MESKEKYIVQQQNKIVVCNWPNKFNYQNYFNRLLLELYQFQECIEQLYSPNNIVVSRKTKSISTFCSCSY